MSDRKPLVVLKTGRKIPTLAAVHGDYEDWIVAGMGWPADTVEIIDATGASSLPKPESLAGVVITGSGSMVTERVDWMLRAADWLADTVRHEVPVLGICFGHQLLAHALGGEVGFNPRGVEVGTVQIDLAEAAAADPLFSVLPPRLWAQLSHRQSVLTLPPKARLLGSSALEPHQAFAFGTRAWGVQFHPEFDAGIVTRFVDYYRDILALQGHSADDMLAEVRAAPESRWVLARFAELVRETM
jgi:GMP synthase (glutamine-hydrolysing)